MDYEVVVVGGGIGGLTAAALLAARGLNVCVFERQSQVGGCVATVEHQGLQFDPTFGLYSGWEQDGIYQSLFSELKCDPPPVSELSPPYIVRLPDGASTPAAKNFSTLEETINRSFPDCAGTAISFFQELTNGASDPNAALTQHPAGEHLRQCSERFQLFIDVQLQTLVQRSSRDCTFAEAAAPLTPQRYWNIDGGAQALASALANSIKGNGGSVRLNSPVLRLAYGADGTPAGIDLLSGERVSASRAIISNLTVWDTFGKLIGLSRSPTGVSAQLRQLRAWGVYQVFLTIDRLVAARLPAPRVLAATGAEPERQFVLTVGADSGSGDNLTATLSTFTPAEDWFSFHEDHEAHEAQDQAMLETVWARLHSAMPELGDSVEVIETATPQTFYEANRRKFGMVGRPNPVTNSLATMPFPNLFLVSDTTSLAPGLAGLTKQAIQTANSIIK